MKKIISLLLFAAVSVSLIAQTGRTYFKSSELPDLVKCLPAPPEKGSPAFKYDLERYKWGKQQRNDPARAEMTRADAVWSYEALLEQLSPAFGMAVSRQDTPKIWRVLENSLLTIDPIRVDPKAYYHRLRPFEYFKESTFTGEDDALRGEGSYPSGHTIRAHLAALLLAEINPARANEIYARAWEYGESRVIAGAHWQSDVDMSRVAASIGYAALQANGVFRKQMASAREEFRSKVLVSLEKAVPDAILEIRYFSTYNFVGKRIDGYRAPTAYLTRQAADSLKAVSDDVMRMGYRLKIYDAYRPQRAVDHFVRWAADVADTTMRRYFYPDVDKSRLFDEEYIMAKSGHTRGSTVDLTLFDMTTEKELDMGGTFDWFGIESHPDYTGITPEQYANRMILREAMLRHGFKPLPTEWWHFTLKDEPFPDTYFNFPVK